MREEIALSHLNNRAFNSKKQMEKPISIIPQLKMEPLGRYLILKAYVGFSRKSLGCSKASRNMSKKIEASIWLNNMHSSGLCALYKQLSL